MKLAVRLILAYVAISLTALYILLKNLSDDIRPRYLQALEESINDTANILADAVSTGADGKPDTRALARIMEQVHARRFSAEIYEFKKDRVSIDVYVTDRNGIVVYDSAHPENLGKDFSKWNDVYLTLRGRYGARSSRAVKEDPSSGALYVASPILNHGQIAGVLTVVKPKDSVTPFIALARQRVIIAGLLALAGMALTGGLSFIWITRPIRRLTAYVDEIQKSRRAVMPDLTGSDIRDLGLAFEKMRTELEGKKYVEMYVRNLTHEIKSPLTSIRASAELLAGGSSKDEKEKLQRNIALEVNRMENMADKLLNLAALESRRELLVRETMSAKLFAEELVDLTSIRLESKRLRMKTVCPEDLFIEGEIYLLRSALVNLIENAADFSSEGGEIELSVQREKTEERDWIAIEVRDRGAGLPDYAQDRVFDRFYSLPRPSNGRKSTGLGLPFVKEVASLHGGSASLGARQAGGATARLLLPVRENEKK